MMELLRKMHSYKLTKKINRESVESKVVKQRLRVNSYFFYKFG